MTGSQNIGFIFGLVEETSPSEVSELTTSTSSETVLEPFDSDRAAAATRRAIPFWLVSDVGLLGSSS